MNFKIIFFNRSNKLGYSIQKVFRPIIFEIKKSNSVKVIEIPNLGSMPWDIFKNFFFTLKFREKNSIHHVTGHIHDVLLALVGVKTVLTIHDLVFIDNVINPIKKFYKWLFWLYIPLKISNKVVCISEHTRRNLLKYGEYNNVSVIHNPIDNSFKYVPKYFNSEKPIILHIGTGWNKNLNRSIEALKDINCHLRIIGKINSYQKDLLVQSNIEYSNLFDLTDEEIRQEYIHCDIVNFPSEYEGFGMPIIEGQKTGRVVVTSKIEPLIEVSGDAVVYVDPFSVKSINDAYLSILNNDSMRNDIIRSGLDNTKRFSLDIICAQYKKLYKSIQ